MPRPGSLALSLALASAPLAVAQDLPPPSPVDLVRGLREAGMPDLAVEYLNEVSVKPTPEVAAVLPLERAKCLLDLANLETDEGVKAGVIAEAKAEFDKFLTTQAKHPRTPEAAVALARLLTLEGKAKLQAARKLTDDAAKKTEAAKARLLFEDAVKRYAAAAAGLDKLSKADGLTPTRKAELVRDYYQAVLDRGINLYNLADSYLDARGDAGEARQKAAVDAYNTFDELWRLDNQHPLGWVARAWLGEAMDLRGEPAKSEALLRDVAADARRTSAPPAAAAGLRMARFFLLRQQFVKGEPAQRSAVRDACRGWLRDYPSARPTAETYAVTYYLGSTLLNQVLMVKENLVIERTRPMKAGDPVEEKVVGVKPEALPTLREADAEFRKVVATDNEYTDRATRQRAKAVRWLIGNPDRPAGSFATFDECYMAALVQIDRMKEATPAEREATAAKVINLLERARELPVPAASARDAVAARITLAQSYNAGNRPYQAAVLAESIARTSRNPAQVARTGLIALYGYQGATEAAGVTNATAAEADRNRMIDLCAFVEKAAPADPNTDAVRFQNGILLTQAGRTREAFEVLSRVPPRFPRVATARLLEGANAYDLVRPRQADEPTRPNDLTPQQKAEVYRRAVADLSAVPVPPKSAKPDESGTFVKVRIRLAKLYLTAGADGYPAAEKTAAEAVATVAQFPDLPTEEKLKLAMECEGLRVRAVFAQAWPLYQAGQFTAAADRFAPLLARMVKDGPAAKPGLTGEAADAARQLDDDRIRLVLVPTLNARVREGSVEKAGELLDQLKAFGGDLSTAAAVVQQAIASVKPTVDTLRKEGKAEEATKLITAVVGMVDKLAGEKNVPPKVRLNLGRSFKDLGEYQRAVTLLSEIPAPEDRTFLPGDPKAAVPPDETDEQKKKREAAFEAAKAAASVYRVAQLELLRCQRLDKQFDKCDALLDDTLGKDRKSGWAVRFPEFRRETLYLSEAKAAEAKTLKEGIPHWNAAIQGWRGWAAELKGAIDGLKAKADDPEEKVNEVRRRKEQLKPAWFDVMTELYRCSVEAQYAVNKADAAKLAAALGKQATSIIDFEKNNAPLPNGIRGKLYALLEGYAELKEAYSKAGGKDLLKAPVIDP